ncbi:unnamed protein product [marine sediment metagenome]|uniref:Uncharacterized protein n=1 Tax=marine sediment metagenome TaxID=412755 RepID=X1BFG8_9ZZZZ
METQTNDSVGRARYEVWKTAYPYKGWPWKAKFLHGIEYFRTKRLAVERVERFRSFVLNGVF